MGGALALLGCGGVVQQPRSVVDRLPRTLCEQITDHIDAYIGYVGCRQPEYDFQFGYFATVAEVQVAGIDCSRANSVADLPYRAERVDAAAYSAMREELQGELGLYGAIHAISWASLGTEITTWNGDESARRQREEELRRKFRAVPALYQPLVSKIAARLGAEDRCDLKLEMPVVLAAGLPSVLERLAKTEDRDGCVKRGLMNFPAGDHIDPNIAVAIARLQRGNMAYMPTSQELEATLRSMGVTVVVKDIVDARVEGK